jgi:hypothetical protein
MALMSPGSAVAVVYSILSVCLLSIAAKPQSGRPDLTGDAGPEGPEKGANQQLVPHLAANAPVARTVIG